MRLLSFFLDNPYAVQTNTLSWNCIRFKDEVSRLRLFVLFSMKFCLRCHFTSFDRSTMNRHAKRDPCPVTFKPLATLAR